MRLSPIVFTLAAMAMLPAAAYAKDDKPAAVRSADASIPFANHGGVRDWRGEGRDTIYFQDTHRRWFKAKLLGTSSDLEFTQFVGIDSSPADTLDKWSTVIIRGQRYSLTSFEAIEGAPPKKVKKPKG
ncbi:MAG: hypothetical protein P0Y56_14480 [Candidatus Andeanibacterium colombiense]|uniref:Uncharacterized protein n=1 Tax=Candidatus Andeanibacterium colombiense TaxID=3121345 RepID=A0AAJ5X7Z0_9SPHN|nr:MAG: hypothetical protein P0Y56_14480 [Sphingomonadaceae bacterium]